MPPDQAGPALLTFVAKPHVAFPDLGLALSRASNTTGCSLCLQVNTPPQLPSPHARPPHLGLWAHP